MMRSFYLGIVVGFVIFVIEAMMRILVGAYRRPPSTCQCGHGRCHHVRGRGQCRGQEQSRSGNSHWPCACQIFIYDKIRTEVDRELTERNAEDFIRKDYVRGEEEK